MVKCKGVAELEMWGPPKQLFDGSRFCNKPAELTNIMNTFFINKVKRIRNNLPLSVGDAVVLAKKQMGMKNCKLN